MFKQAIIHYPSDEKVLSQISKEIADFRCLATIKYIKSLKMNAKQIEKLYAALSEEIAARKQKSA